MILVDTRTLMVVDVEDAIHGDHPQILYHEL